jgi:hypothetical protein
MDHARFSSCLQRPLANAQAHIVAETGSDAVSGIARPEIFGLSPTVFEIRSNINEKPSLIRIEPAESP